MPNDPDIIVKTCWRCRCVFTVNTRYESYKKDTCNACIEEIKLDKGDAEYHRRREDLEENL